MAYIGNIPAEKFTSVDIQNFTVSATANYTLDRPVANENEIELFINNVRQHPGSGKAYTASGTAITLSEATAGTDTMYCVYQGKARQTVTPATSSVTNDMLAGSIADAKISAMAASKLTGTVAQANIADEAINEAKLQISNAPTNGYMLTAQSGNTGGLTWAEAPSGTLVQTGSAFNTSNAGPSVGVTNCFSSTYDFYQIHFYFHFANNTAGLRFRIVDSGGERQESQYQYASPYKDSSNSDGQHTSESESYINISNSNSQGYDDGGIHGVLQVHLNNGHGTTSHSNTFSMTGYYKNSPDNGQNRVRAYHHASNYIDTIANHTATGFNFYSTSGNLEFCNVKVYGLDGSSS